MTFVINKNNPRIFLEKLQALNEGSDRIITGRRNFWIIKKIQRENFEKKIYSSTSTSAVSNDDDDDDVWSLSSSV